MLQVTTKRNQTVIERGRSSPVDRADQTPAIDIPAPFRLGAFGWSFIVCVVLPVIFSIFYLALIATEEFVSEAKFTIRTASENNSSLISDAVSNISASIGMGARTTSQDVFIVADYILSRTIIEDLGGQTQLYRVYSKPEVDWLSRLSPSASIEKVWKYWKNKVRAFIDTPSGIVTLEVRAYSREDAHQLAQRILSKSEELVNAISERSRQDALARAKGELNRAEERLRQSQLALLVFRNQEKLIDPSLSAQSLGELISKLTQERVVLENNRATLRRSIDQNSPTIRVLSAQIDAIDKQIEGIKNQLTSNGQGSTVSAQISGYENLQIEAQFAEKIYSIAQASYEKARVEQEKQQLYLVTIDRPSQPQKATYPRIFLDTLTIFAACFILWSMMTLLVATVRDHMGG